MLRRIQRKQARLGMYVHAFDGSWISHPFWRPRFLIETPDSLDRLLASTIPSLVIDESRGVAFEPTKGVAVSPGRTLAAAAPMAGSAPSRQSDSPCSFTQERERASQIAARSTRVVREVLDGARLGRPVRAQDVEAAVEEIVASVHRNPHALIGLTRLRSKDEYTYVHSVAVGALMVNLARHIGLNPREIHELGVAGLLHDVGKMVVPDRVLNKPGPLSDDEFALIRTHPEQGYRLLTEGDGAFDIALDVARHHHERIDGTGYPLRLCGPEISVYARIAAIADVYDALTSCRAYKDAWTPSTAIAKMHDWEGHFDRSLLFQFMQSIAAFPVGMLVRLRSNRLGVVLANGRRASRPRVRAFYSTRERAMMAKQIVIIDDNLADDQILSEEQPEDWGITDWPALKERLLLDQPLTGRKAA